MNLRRAINSFPIAIAALTLTAMAGERCCIPFPRREPTSRSGDIMEELKRSERVQAVVDLFRKATPQPKSPVPIVYHSRLDPWPLAQYQVREILSRAEKVRPDGRDTWFIMVRMNYVRHWRLCCEATIYFTPDMSTPRLRKGRCTGFFLSAADIQMLERLIEKLEREQGRPSSRKSREELSQYYEVSIREKPFTDQLDVPTGTLMPFHPPEGFTDDEIVEIVDFVRTSPKRPPDPPNRVSIPQRLDGSEPILSIERKGEDIAVRTGIQEGPLSGIGETIVLRKKGNTFEVISIGMWVS
jgi:hypothetical protein